MISKIFLVALAMTVCTRGDMCCNYWSLPQKANTFISQ